MLNSKMSLNENSNVTHIGIFGPGMDDSAGCRRSLLKFALGGLPADSMFFHPVDQRLTAEIKESSGVGLVPVEFPQGTQD